MVVDQRMDEVRAENALCALRKQFGDRKNVELTSCVGDPGTEIVDYAKRMGADLIVMSSHGRTGLKRILLGSVAERVARTAECPVMIVRQPAQTTT